MVNADEFQSLKAKFQEEKVKAKRLWRMNCSLAVEQEALLNENDAKIASLQQRLTLAESNTSDVLA